MPNELIDQGYLVKPSYYSLNQADWEKVGTLTDDEDETELALACDQPELIEQIVQDWKRLAYGRRTIAFAVNVTHSQNLCAAFQAARVPAAHVDGTTPLQMTKEIYQQLDSGPIVLSSCMKLTEGFDVPAVSAILLCRPTNSKALYFQMVGRGLRLSPETDKLDCVVLDFAGNVQRHGFIEDLKEISLDRGQELKSVEAPKKVCPTGDGGCGAILYAFFIRCPKCGYVFQQRQKVFIVSRLEQLLPEKDLERYEFYQEKIRTAYERNFAPGWAALVFKDQYGHWPPDAWAQGAIFANNATASNQVAYHTYLKAIAQRKQKPDSWVERHLRLEFGFRGGLSIKP